MTTENSFAYPSFGPMHEAQIKHCNIDTSGKQIIAKIDLISRTGKRSNIVFMADAQFLDDVVATIPHILQHTLGVDGSITSSDIDGFVDHEGNYLPGETTEEKTTHLEKISLDVALKLLDSFYTAHVNALEGERSSLHAKFAQS